MKIILLTILLLIMNCQTANTQNNSVEKTGELNPPKALEIFEPNVISNFNRWTFTPTFSKNMQTLVFVGWENPDLSVNQTTIQKLYKSKKVNGKWTEPIEIKETKGFRVDWAHFSPDGKALFFASNRPVKGQKAISDNAGNRSIWAIYWISLESLDTMKITLPRK